MSKWFPDVSTYDGVRGASNGGFYACLAFAVMNVLGLVALLLSGQRMLIGQDTPANPGAIIGVLFELTLIMAAAWRFKRGNGLVIGSIVLLVFTLEIVVKIATGTTSPPWFLLYAAVFAGLINGIRGAWAGRLLPGVDPTIFS